jgi:carnitine O-acetyltransferase
VGRRKEAAYLHRSAGKVSFNRQPVHYNLYSPPDFYGRALLAISSHASSKANEQKPIPLLTSWDRENWAVARNHLLAVGPVGNRKSLSAIEDALFVISLDNYSNGADSPSYGETGYCGQQNLGQGHNRWFDKPATVILENSGKAMLMGEHSPLDALPVDHFFTYLLWRPVVSASGIADGEDLSQFAWLTDAPAPKGDPLESIPIVEHLTWTTDEKVDACLEQAQLAANATFTQFRYYNLWFDDFGNEDIRRVTKLALDPLYQMAIQLTYYRTHSTITPTYETAQTRTFRHGRTETIRVCSMKSKQFVEAFDDPEISEKVHSCNYSNSAHPLKTHPNLIFAKRKLMIYLSQALRSIKSTL